MIVLDCEQGSRQWLEARLGIPTASEMSRVVTPTGKLSAARDTYLAELLAEFFTGEQYSDFESSAMERGKVLEPEAFDEYGFLTDTEPTKVGLIFKDESRMVGASPDGLVGDAGGLELKCPLAPTHLLWLARGECPKQHWCQVQTSIWVSGREWWDFMSYFPELPPLRVRVEPDEGYQKALDKHVPVFIEEMLEARERLAAMGVQPALQAAA